MTNTTDTAHLDTLLARNATYAREEHRARPIAPDTTTIVVSCSDSRTDPSNYLGVADGEAVVIRNAGGRVTADVEREIGLLVAMMRTLDAGDPQIVLVHHTDCGAQRLADAGVREVLASASGLDADELAGRAITDHAESLRADIERLRTSTVVPDGLVVTGLVYDTESGIAEVNTSTGRAA